MPKPSSSRSLGAGLASAAVLPALRRVEFRGKRRLRGYVPVPEAGEATARFPGGMRLSLDLSEPLQRDFYFGLYDRLELSLLRRLLQEGGDAVDVGAYIGLYTVASARALRGRGRVLAFEPHPVSRERLARNLALNGCENVIVSPLGVSDAAGRTALAVPRSGDASWSTLEPALLTDAELVEIETSTVDDEVERLGLEPRFVKIDVEGHELKVAHGMPKTLERRPAVLCEVGPSSAAILEHDLTARGYRSFRVEPVGLRVGLGGVGGLFNALFLPEERLGELGR